MRVIIYILMLIFPLQLMAQERPTYEQLMNDGKYEEALPIIQGELRSIYDKRVDNKRIPNDFILIGSADDAIDLNKLFRTRKVELFFIEENDRLFKLHKDAAQSFLKTGAYNQAVQHYYQSLRFRPLQYEEDDDVFYGIAQAFKEQGLMGAYHNSLETAYEMNPEKYDYSLELGKALYRTKEKKRAIYHLKRYIDFKGDTLTDINLYIMIGNLNEEIGRYLETVKYYRKYLNTKKNDGNILFSLGYLAYNRTGDYDLALESLNGALANLPEDDIFRRSKSYEYIGDISFKELKFDRAIESYGETVKYQEKVLATIDAKDKEIKSLATEIRELKAGLLKKQDYVKFNEYQFQKSEKVRLEVEKEQIVYSYNKLNPGKVRWNIAECYEKKEDYNNAIRYYRESVRFNHKANRARKKIIKLQLKIKRGY